MKPYGKNTGGYFGEKIDIDSVLFDILAISPGLGWEQEIVYTEGGHNVWALKRERSKGRKVYISAGIHGDEPAGPLAMLELIKRDILPKDVDIWLLPCLNPKGFLQGTRENEKGIDLNRDYRDAKTPEVKAHIAWLDRQPEFDLTLCLHEDWEAKGFYILMTENDEKKARHILDSVGRVFPIDLSPVIESFPARQGLVHPPFKMEERPQWPEAFYLKIYKKGEHYTLESASDFALMDRVNALVVAVLAAF